MKYSGNLTKTAGSSETSVITYKTVRRYNPEDRDRHYSHKFMCFSFRVCYRKKSRHVIKLNFDYRLDFHVCIRRSSDFGERLWRFTTQTIVVNISSTH